MYPMGMANAEYDFLTARNSAVVYDATNIHGTPRVIVTFIDREKAPNSDPDNVAGVKSLTTSDTATQVHNVLTDILGYTLHTVENLSQGTTLAFYFKAS